MTKPTVQNLVDAFGAKESRDGNSAVVSLGSMGYVRLIPSEVTLHGEDVPAVEIEVNVRRRSGGIASEWRDKVRAAGLEVR